MDVKVCYLLLLAALLRHSSASNEEMLAGKNRIVGLGAEIVQETRELGYKRIWREVDFSLFWVV
jgi:hypothetical protein